MRSCQTYKIKTGRPSRSCQTRRRCSAGSQDTTFLLSLSVKQHARQAELWQDNQDVSHGMHEQRDEAVRGT